MSLRLRITGRLPPLRLSGPEGWHHESGIQDARLVRMEVPLPANHPFRSLDNVLATPHIGYVARDLYGTFFGDTAKNITRWLGDCHERDDTGEE